MRVLIYEHLTARIDCEPDLPPSLAAEGWAMLNSLCEDSRALPGVEIHTIAGPAGRFGPHVRVHPADPAVGWLNAFQEVVEQVDAALVIAPEFSHILETLVRRVEQSNKVPLGSSSIAIAMAADKWASALQWRARNVPTPTASVVSDLRDASALREFRYPAVLKPRDGAGSLATILLRNASEWEKSWAEVSAENPGSDWIVMPYVEGKSVSASCIVGDSNAIVLPAAAQHLSEDGRFRYRGGEVPLPADLTRRAQSLALEAVSAIDGLRGYVSVDMVLGAAADGSQDWAIEINPRITTSYLGLRALCRSNLLEAILAACSGGVVPELSWKNDIVRFHANGAVTSL
jgi:tyramine---L-glutamate ligase